MALWPLVIAIGLVIMGAIGLEATRQNSVPAPAASNIDSSKPSLSVRDSQVGDSPQQQKQGAQALQNAARVNDLIQGKKATDLQQGAAVDELLKNRQLQ